MESKRRACSGILEICIDSVASARAAADGGADRVELCAALPEGGTTPSAGMIEAVRKVFPGRLMVIIRPRGCDFLYDEDEMDIMRRDLRIARECGANGVVIGCLRADGTVDEDRCRDLLAHVADLDVTFHRAFDMSRDLFEAIRSIHGLGIRRVLSSGGLPDVPAGTELLRSLIDLALPGMVVMPGGGITPDNLAETLARTGACEVHLAACRSVASGMVWRSSRCHMGDFTRADEYSWRVANADSIRRCREILDQHREA